MFKRTILFTFFTLFLSSALIAMEKENSSTIIDATGVEKNYDETEIALLQKSKTLRNVLDMTQGTDAISFADIGNAEHSFITHENIWRLLSCMKQQITCQANANRTTRFYENYQLFKHMIDKEYAYSIFRLAEYLDFADEFGQETVQTLALVCEDIQEQNPELISDDAQLIAQYIPTYKDADEFFDEFCNSDEKEREVYCDYNPVIDLSRDRLKKLGAMLAFEQMPRDRLWDFLTTLEAKIFHYPGPDAEYEVRGLKRKVILSGHKIKKIILPDFKEVCGLDLYIDVSNNHIEEVRFDSDLANLSNFFGRTNAPDYYLDLRNNCLTNFIAPDWYGKWTIDLRNNDFSQGVIKKLRNEFRNKYYPFNYKEYYSNLINHYGFPIIGLFSTYMTWRMADAAMERLKLDCEFPFIAKALRIPRLIRTISDRLFRWSGAYLATLASNMGVMTLYSQNVKNVQQQTQDFNQAILSGPHLIFDQEDIDFPKPIKEISVNNYLTLPFCPAFLSAKIAVDLVQGENPFRPSIPAPGPIQ